MTLPKWWSGTLSKEVAKGMFIDDAATLGSYLAKHCDRCLVGDEVGESGYQHYQIKCVFGRGIDLEGLGKLLPGAHWSPTHVKNFEYEMKEGRYWASWEGALRDFATIQLWRWQQEAIDLLKQQDDRRILCIVDEEGCSGKTTLAKYIVANHIGAYCPIMEDAKDYMAWALAHKTAGAFIIDCPRAEDNKHERALWSAIEQMKNGYLWDKRNQWREAWIEPPKVMVITNDMPNTSLLSYDRWDIKPLTKKYGIPEIDWERIA